MKSPLSLRAAIMPLLLALLAGCDRSPATTQSSALPTISMKVGSRVYSLEVAADHFSRERGLMERDSMPADRGMIFIFDQETDRAFWMKNTRIPLDILFLDSAGKIVSIHTMKPYDEQTTPSNGPSRYAIELNAGAANDCGAKVGDRLAIPQTTAGR